MPVSTVATLGIPLVQVKAGVLYSLEGKLTSLRQQACSSKELAKRQSTPVASPVRARPPVKRCYLTEKATTVPFCSPTRTQRTIDSLFTIPSQRPTCLSMRLYNGKLRSNVAVMCKRARIPMGIARMRQQCIPGRFFLPRKKWPGNEARPPLALGMGSIVSYDYHYLCTCWRLRAQV